MNLSQPIECSVLACDEPATQGGAFEHKPNHQPPTHPIYYACPEHGSTLAPAYTTWQVAP